MSRSGPQLLLWVLIIWSSIGCKESESSTRAFQTQVLVIGGSTSGTAAAIQAARGGVQVVLIEETPWLGGMLTAAGVSATDGNHRLPSGLWGEFRQMIYDHYGGPDSVATGWVSNTHFEPKVGNKVWNRLAEAEPNLKRFHGYQLSKVLKQGNTITGGVFLSEQGDSLTVMANVTIDATELGDVLALAGAKYLLGQDPAALTKEIWAPENGTNHIQDLTFTAILKDYGPEVDKTITKPLEYDPEEFNCACQDLCNDVDFEVVDCLKMLDYARLPNDKLIINWPINGNDYYVNCLEMSKGERLQAYQKAKERTLSFLYYLQTAGGFKNLGLAEDEFPTADHLPLIPYHRESRRVVGASFLTVNDLADPYSSQLYQSAIAVGDYPLDHHHDKNPHVAGEVFPSIPSFAIPYGSLIPEKIDGLIVAEKSISVSHLANGATRLQPCVILIGQAAGGAAALCVRADSQPRRLNVKTLQQILLDADCWLLPFIDTAPDDTTYFQAIQRVGLSGVMKGKGIPYQWANQTWFYPDSLVGNEHFSEIYLAISGKEIELESDLTRSQAIAYFDASICNEIWGETSETSEKVTRKELAYLIDRAFDPFSKTD
ncbi:MAG: FAD-dependent oxidoreductase [Cyclobacteriaceae bacterium]